MKNLISILLSISLFVSTLFTLSSCSVYDTLMETNNTDNNTDETEYAEDTPKQTYTEIELTSSNFKDYLGCYAYNDNINIQDAGIHPSLGWQTYIITYTIIIEFYPKSQNYKFENVQISTSLGKINLDGYGYGRGQRYVRENRVSQHISEPSVSINNVSGQVLIRNE